MSTQTAGWAEVDITPELGVPLGGRGPQFAPITEILDPLNAHALILSDTDGNSVLFVSLDLVGIGTVFGLALRHRLAVMTGVPYNAIVINFSHTHSGPMTILDKYPVAKEPPENLIAYDRFLEEQVVTAALAALERMRPVTVAAFTGSSDTGVNRRRRAPDGAIELQPNRDGFFNDEVWGIDIQAADMQAAGTHDSVASPTDRCVLFGYGCHAVTVYSWKWQACSADYPGAARNEIARALGPGVHAQFLQGFGGNIRPRRLADFDTGIFRESLSDDHIEIGSELARVVVDAIESGATATELSIRSGAGHFMARRDEATIRPLSHWQVLADSDSELESNFGAYWADTVSNNRPIARAVPWDIGIVELSKDVSAAWMAGEVCAEWLPLIRKWTGRDDMHAIGYCHDLPGYLPTSSLIAEGGYEVERSNWYRKTGPGSYESGIEDVARVEFLRLQSAIATEVVRV